MPDDATAAVGSETPPASQEPVIVPTVPTLPPPDTDEDEAYDKERALATIRKLRAEAKSAVAAIKERDQLKAQAQQAADAQLSKEDQLTKRASQLEADLSTERRAMADRINRYETQLAAVRLGIVDPDAAVKLLDWTALEYADDGTPRDIDSALKRLVREKPYLASPPTPAMSATNSATRTGAPGSRIYTRAELGDYEYYQKHRDDIVLAMREGRVE